MEVRAWWSCGAGLLVVVVESAKKPVEVGLGVAPVERGGGLLVAALEGQQASFDLVQVGEVVGRQHFALHDGEVDLDLVQPGSVHRQVDQAQVPPAAFQPVDRGLAAVGAAIVDDPKHSLGRGVGLGGHDLGDQPAERVDASGGLAAAEQVGVVDIPGGQIRQRSAAVVFVLDAHTARWACWPGRMAAAARLDLGFLIGRQHVLVVAQQLALEEALVQVQNPAGLGGEVWGPREDPRVVPPRLDGILGQPAAQRRGRDRLDQPAADDLSPQLLKAPPADRNATGHWQFTGDRLDLGHDGRREHPRPARPFAIPESVHPLGGVALAPLGGGVGCDPELAGDPCIGPPAGGQQYDPGPGDLPLLRGWLADQRLEPPTLRSPERALKRAAPAPACHCTAPPWLFPAAPDRTATRQDTASTKRAGSAKMTPCQRPSPNRPRSRWASGCVNASRPAGPPWPPSTYASAVRSPMSTVSSPTSNDSRCAGYAMAGRPAGGALPSTSPAATATRTPSCQPVCTPAPLNKPWTAPAGCTSTTPPPGRIRAHQPAPNHARTSIRQY